MKLKPSVVPGDIGDEHEFSGKKNQKNQFIYNLIQTLIKTI